MTDPFVVCAIPIRNRAWAVPLLFDALDAQTRRIDALLFVTGDNEDDTEPVLRANAHLGALEDVVVDCFDTGCPGWSRDGEVRYSVDDHAALARVYNRCLDRSLELWPQATHVWMLDSDVIPEPDVLELLLAADKPVVAAVVRNSPGVWNFMLGLGENGEPYRVGLEESAPAVILRNGPQPFQAPFVSACVLYERWVIEDDICVQRADAERSTTGPARFSPDPRSHDFGMMAHLRGLGVYPWVEPRARCAHYFHGPGEEPLR